MYKNFIKPFFDKLVAFIGLLLISPVILLVMLFLFVFQDRRVFFTQERPGKNGKIFKLVKFKTMNDNTDSNGQLLPDAKRMTKIGVFVRKTSLDELPQLINVLFGEMSLVGPRPLLIEYLTLYNASQARRHEVMPGITGWAQVNGRNAIAWKKKLELDIWYVDHISFWLDLKILWLTILKVFVREGISSSTSVTIEKFTGN